MSLLLVALCAVVLGQPVAALGQARMATGKYTGDGTASRAIAGVGFAPEVVLIKGVLNQRTVIRTATMTGDASKELTLNGSLEPDHILSLDVDGFTVGSDSSVNDNGVVYYWTAFQSNPGDMVVGSYVGDAKTDRHITTGFPPAYAIIIGEGTVYATQRIADLAANRSYPFSASASNANRIKGFDATGMVIGNNVHVNAAGETYHYIAWADRDERLKTGMFVGDGTTARDITAPGFQPDLVILQHAAGAFPAVMKTFQLTSEATLPCDTSPTIVSGGIKKLLPAGFTVGDHVGVNDAGQDMFYVVFGDGVSASSADLAVGASVDEEHPDPGQSITFAIEVTNGGPGNATGVALTDQLPSGLAFVSATPSTGVYDDITGVWNVGQVMSGATETLTINATVNPGAAGAVISNVAEVTALNEWDPNTTDNTAAATVSVVANEFRVTTGTYTGSGAGPRSITGLGVQPAAVIVRAASATAFAVARTATMAAGMSKPLGTNVGLVPDRIVSLDNDGFTIGSDPDVNTFGVAYYWTAFCAGESTMALGTYVGDGVDNRDYTTVGFQPDYLIVMAETNQDAMQRFSTEPFDESIAFHNDGPHTDRIQDFNPLGFQLGKHNTVNENGTRYHYLAWREAPGAVEQSSYTGTGAPDSITTSFPLSYLIVKNNGAQEGVARSNDTGGFTLPFRDRAPFADGITALHPDRFDLGADDRVNKSGESYHWVAFRGSPVADLSIAASADDNMPNVGDTVRVAVALTNLGPSGASGVQVVDALPAGLEYAGHTTTQGSYVDGTGLWGVGVVAPGDTARLWIDAVVGSGTAGTTIANVAAVTSSNETDPVPVNDTDATSIVVQGADLALTMTAAAPWVFEGDTLVCTVTVANNGPDPATGVVISAPVPAGLTYASYNATAGSYDNATGAWSMGTITGGAEHIDINYVVAPGTMGEVITGTALVGSVDQGDPVAGNNAASINVQVATPISIDDEPGTLYPSATFAGQPDLKIRIGLDNGAAAGVWLDTSCEVEFGDGVNTFVASLSNPTYVPAGAADYTVTFAPSAVSAATVANASYPMTLRLSGSSDESIPYADTLTTTGTNEIQVKETRVGVEALIVGDYDVLPGTRSETLLALKLSNGYATPRSLDTLVVSNTSSGAGTPAQIDAEVEALRLYADADSSGTFSAGDDLLATATFAGGRAAFAVGAAWVLPAHGAEQLVVTADVDSFSAADGDVIDAAILWDTDVAFVEPTELDDITPLSPVNSYGAATVDGMAAHQVALIPAAPDTLYSGELDRLLATVVVPRNGYESDVLQGFQIMDASGGFDPADFSAVRLYLDDGDGVFEPVSDASAGSMAYSGDRYTITGLGIALDGPTRFFVAADLSPAPGNGDTFRARIPVGGVSVASGNDGPVDAAVTSAGDIVLVAIEQVDVTTLPLAAASPHPGDHNVPLLRLRLVNSTLQPVTLDSVRVENASSGAGSGAELDGTFAAIRVYADDGNGVVDAWDTALAEGPGFSSGVLVTALDATISVGTPYNLLVTCDIDSFCAADLDTVRVRVADANALQFNSPQTVKADFPLVTAATRVIDGMLRHQIIVHASADSTVITSPSDNLVFDFELTGNGYQSDTLRTLRLINDGTATPEHIARLALYVDGGDGSFDVGSGDDAYVADFVTVGLNEYILNGLDVALGSCAAYTRFFVAADVPPTRRRERRFRCRYRCSASKCRRTTTGRSTRRSPTHRFSSCPNRTNSPRSPIRWGTRACGRCRVTRSTSGSASTTGSQRRSKCRQSTCSSRAPR